MSEEMKRDVITTDQLTPGVYSCKRGHCYYDNILVFQRNGKLFESFLGEGEISCAALPYARWISREKQFKKE